MRWAQVPLILSPVVLVNVKLRTEVPQLICLGWLQDVGGQFV